MEATIEVTTQVAAASAAEALEKALAAFTPDFSLVRQVAISALAETHQAGTAYWEVQLTGRRREGQFDE